MTQPRGVIAVTRSLGPMLGVGLLIAAIPASTAAGPWLLAAVALAVVTVVCAKVVQSSLERSLPGYRPYSYQFARDQLGVWAARIAVSTRIIGRSAAAATLAALAGTYLMPTHSIAAAICLLIFGALRVPWRMSLLSSTLTISALVLGLLVIGVSWSIESVVIPSSTQVAGSSPISLEHILSAACVLVISFSPVSSGSNANQPTAPVLRTGRYYVMLIFAVLSVVGVSFSLLRQLGPIRLSISDRPLSDMMIAADGQSLAVGVAVIAGMIAVLLLPCLFQDLREIGAELADSAGLPVRNAIGQDLIGYGLAALGVIVATPQTTLAIASCATALSLAFFAASARIALYDNFVRRGARLACVVIGLTVILAMSVPVQALVGVCVGIAGGTGVLGMISARARRSRTSRRRTRSKRQPSAKQLDAKLSEQ